MSYENCQPDEIGLCADRSLKPHICCVCGKPWYSPNKKTALKVEKAVKINKDGPYCILCLHLEMAARYAEARGYRRVRRAMSAWARYNKNILPLARRPKP